jgi:hypothetical protein
MIGIRREMMRFHERLGKDENSPPKRPVMADGVNRKATNRGTNGLIRSLDATRDRLN